MHATINRLACKRKRKRRKGMATRTGVVGVMMRTRAGMEKKDEDGKVSHVKGGR